MSYIYFPVVHICIYVLICMYVLHICKCIVHICKYVVEKVNELEQDEIPIPIMHNIVESALEQVKPIVAKSYRDYRNYKHDFVRMLDDVYKKSQSIMYIGDKENANTDSALVSTKRS